MSARAVPVWVGKTPDTPAPPRVKLRVLERFNRRCYLTGALIRTGDKWDVEHIIALVNGGENAENNLAPALKAPHKEKTRSDMAIKKKNASVMKRHYGLKRTSRPLPGGRNSPIKKKINGEVVRRG